MSNFRLGCVFAGHIYKLIRHDYKDGIYYYECSKCGKTKIELGISS